MFELASPNGKSFRFVRTWHDTRREHLYVGLVCGSSSRSCPGGRSLGLAWLGLAWLGLAWLGLAPLNLKAPSPNSLIQRVRGCAFNSKCGWLGLGGTDYTEPDRKFVAELSQRWVGQEVGPHEDHKRTTSTKCTGKT